MRIHRSLLTAAISIVVLSTGCVKSWVITAGSYHGTNMIVPRLWSFTLEADLPIPSTANIGEAHAVYLYQGGLYVAGHYYDGKRRIPCYWTATTKAHEPGVNWIRTDLDVGDASGVANSIYVAGGTVYTAGYYESATGRVPCYWTGTSRTDLDAVGAGGEAKSIYVSGGTVYTAGYYDRQVAGSFIPAPCYWTGKSRTDLDDDGGGGEAKGIYVAGGTVYAAGFYHNYPGGPCNNSSSQQVARYWAGKAKADLFSDCSIQAAANSIFVSGGTVYTAGNYYNGKNTIPCYWTGTNKTNLDSVEGDATSIGVSGGTVYTAGYLSSVAVGGQFACFWKDTTRILLPGNGGRADSIFVIP